MYTRLAADIGARKRVLCESVQFHRYFPIRRHVAKLTRIHYQLLCPIADPKQREALTLFASLSMTHRFRTTCRQFRPIAPIRGW